MHNRYHLPVVLPSKTAPPITIQDKQELIFSMGIKPFASSQLTQDFLQNQGIIPQNWKLKTLDNQPDLVKLDWQGHLIIKAQSNWLFFQENLDPQSLQPSVAAKIATEFVNKITNVTYQSLQLSIQRCFSISNYDKFATNYLQNTLLSPGLVQKVSNNWLGGEINYCYQLKQGKFYFTVKANQQCQSSFLIFMGKFNYSLLQFPAQAKQNQIKKIINNWQQDYQIFIDLINSRFLA
jgi:hypothetical protein